MNRRPLPEIGQRVRYSYCENTENPWNCCCASATVTETGEYKGQWYVGVVTDSGVEDEFGADEPDLIWEIIK